MEESAKNSSSLPPIEGAGKTPTTKRRRQVPHPQRPAEGKKRKNHVRPSRAGRSDVEAEWSMDAKPVSEDGHEVPFPRGTSGHILFPA